MTEQVTIAKIARCPHCNAVVAWIHPSVGKHQMELDIASWNDRGLIVESWPADLKILINDHSDRCPRKKW